jgi:23S rRNA (guanine2445-N2)-methyltransferase / 23S rRNA (guanine2069-N7)-methyltransferase
VPGGVILFSNNFTRFKLDADALSAFAIEDITKATLPWDFRRSPKIHKCFVLRLANGKVGGGHGRANVASAVT